MGLLEVGRIKAVDVLQDFTGEIHGVPDPMLSDAFGRQHLWDQRIDDLGTRGVRHIVLNRVFNADTVLESVSDPRKLFQPTCHPCRVGAEDVSDVDKLLHLLVRLNFNALDDVQMAKVQMTSQKGSLCVQCILAQLVKIICAIPFRLAAWIIAFFSLRHDGIISFQFPSFAYY